MLRKPRRRGSTFVQIADLPTDPFDSVLCSSNLLGACVPQPGTAVTLETLTVWPMWRLQYRNFGEYESMVFNHTVDANGNDLAGVRWYELRRRPGGAWAIHQQATHSTDNMHRWMGSIAQDGFGNMALGYSVSSRTEFPGIRAATRLGTDPIGTLPQGELTLVTGAGAQTHSARRWGNYSSMDVDPVDDCTFWFTTEYYDTTSSAGWKTRISSFSHPECIRGDKPEVFSYEYATKIVCGLQRDPKDMRLARGHYATAINIHNPNQATAVLRKKLALTHPPGDQVPGKVIVYGKDKLGYDEALETDCMDVQKRAFDGRFPSSYIKGFVVVQSTQSLDVTAVYTTVGLDPKGRVGQDNDIDVEQIKERKVRGDEGQCPDLVVQDIGRPSVSCPTGGGSCRTTVDITIANVGSGAIGSFDIRATFDPAQGVVVDQTLPGLSAGASQTVTVTTPPGGNCFDPDCTITVFADPEDKTRECKEDNNKSSNTGIG